MLDQLRCVQEPYTACCPKLVESPKVAHPVRFGLSRVTALILSGAEFSCSLTFPSSFLLLWEGLNKILVSLRLYFEVNILPGNASCLYHMPRITLHVEGNRVA